VEPIVDPVVDLVEPIVDPVVDLVEPIVDPVVDQIEPITEVVLPALEASAADAPRGSGRGGIQADAVILPGGDAPVGASAPLTPVAPPSRSPLSLPPTGASVGSPLLAGAALALLGAWLLATLFRVQRRQWSLAFIPGGRSPLPAVPPA